MNSPVGSKPENIEILVIGALDQLLRLNFLEARYLVAQARCLLVVLRL